MLKAIRIRLLHDQFPVLLACSKTNALKNNKLSHCLNPQKSSKFLSGRNRKFMNNQVNPVAFFQSDSEKSEVDQLSFRDFHRTEKKNKQGFLDAIKMYEDNFPSRRGHVEFVQSAIKQMKEFGVHEDLEAYKLLLNVMPKGPFVARNRLHIEMMYFPKQQFAALELLQQIEHYGITPDVELGNLLISIFGSLSYPCQKYYKILYWSTKFKNKSPWPLLKQLPPDPFLLGKLAVERITSVDIQTEISVLQTSELPESIDKTWIVSGQSPKQKELLKNHLPTSPVVVEGGDIIWLRKHLVNYFILKADCEPYELEEPKSKEDLLDMESIYLNLNYKEEKEGRSCHVQDDGIIYAVCTTGTSSKDSLLSWIRLLQKNGNPTLGNVPVLFRFKSVDRTSDVQAVTLTSQ